MALLLGAAVIVIGGPLASAAWRDAGEPAQFADRVRLASCGAVEQRVAGQLPSGDAGQCFATAMRSDTAAELRVATLTTEGDPVVAYYRALRGSPGLEIYFDNTKDRHRSADWTLSECPAARGIDDLGTCLTRDLR